LKEKVDGDCDAQSTEQRCGGERREKNMRNTAAHPNSKNWIGFCGCSMAVAGGVSDCEREVGHGTAIKA
jgi:hypothetical protein